MKIAISVLVLASAAWTQTVVHPSQVPCADEEVQSNLQVKTARHISGELKDPTGAPFADSKVELRLAGSNKKFVTYRKTATDKLGHFDLGEVEPGKYRFLAAPNRGWKQPKEISCGRQPHCELSLVLELNATDQPYAGCPIQ
jgi:protocatechuate 3,4-dioxygenase beta subunit